MSTSLVAATAVRVVEVSDRNAMVSLLNGIEHAPAVVWRARLTPRWADLLVVLFPVLDILLSPFGDISSLVSDAIGIVGFGILGWRTLTAPDESWDQVPEVAPEIAPVPMH